MTSRTQLTPVSGRQPRQERREWGVYSDRNLREKSSRAQSCQKLPPSLSLRSGRLWVRIDTWPTCYNLYFQNSNMHLIIDYTTSLESIDWTSPRFPSAAETFKWAHHTPEACAPGPGQCHQAIVGDPGMVTRNNNANTIRIISSVRR